MQQAKFLIGCLTLVSAINLNDKAEESKAPAVNNTIQPIDNSVTEPNQEKDS